MDLLVSVIIPSYNHAQYITQAINSVFSQEYDAIELIVVDDGSSDGTHDVLKKYSDDPRLKVILNEKNRGQSAVLNQALLFAQGKYICFLPSDDWFLPGKILSQVMKFREADKETGIIYGRGLRYFTDTQKTISVDLPLYSGWVLDRLIRQGNFVYPVTPMFRRECFDNFLFDETYKAEGEAIYLKMALKYKFDFVDEVVGVMRDHEYNTGKNSQMMYEDNLRYWNEFFNCPELDIKIQKMRHIPVSRLHRLKGLEAITLHRDFITGRKALINAIKENIKYVTDIKLIAGLILSCSPSCISNHMLNLKSKCKSAFCE